MRRDDYFYMNGPAVFNFTVERVPLLVKDTLAVNDLQSEDIDYYVFHQANKFMLNTIRKACGIAKDKFYVNLETTGNTTSTTIPLALVDCLEQNKFISGDKVLVAGFGVGLSWAGTILTFK